VRRRLLFGLSLVALLASTAAEAAAPAGSTWSQAYIEAGDGTLLHADVFHPAAPGDSRTPAVVVVSPYLGIPALDDPSPPNVPSWHRELYDALIEARFTVVQVSFRGTGASQGCEDFGGSGERADVRAAVSWARSQGWSTGRVGMIGHSYEGFAAVMALAERVPGLAAAVLTAPAIDLYRGIYMNGVGYQQSPVVAPYYQAFQLIPPFDPTAALSAYSGRFSNLECLLEVAREGQNPDPRSDFWRARDFSWRAASSVPVMWTHGFLDGRDDYSSVRPDNFLDLWRRLRGPKRAWFGQFPHLVPGQENTWGGAEPVGRDGFTAEAVDWLLAHVVRDGPARDRVRRLPTVAIQEGATGEWRSEPAWPPPGARDHSLALLPGSYLDAPGNKGEAAPADRGTCLALQARCNPASVVGRGSWTFSRPLRGGLHLSAPPAVRLSLTGPEEGFNAIVLVYDVSQAMRATLLTRGAARVSGGRAVLDFELYPQDWRLREGHRVGVLVSGADDFYFSPGASLAEVRVGGGELVLPLRRSPRDSILPGYPSRAVADRTSFPVDPGLVTARSSPLVARRLPRLRVRVRPRRVRAGRRAVLYVVVRARRGDRLTRVPGARIRIGPRRARTGRRGAARLKVRLRRDRPPVVRARRAGYLPGRARLRVLPRRVPAGRG
jgi:predicted acyl esterase